MNRLTAVMILLSLWACAKPVGMQRIQCGGRITNDIVVGQWISDAGETLYLNTNCEGKTSRCALDFEYEPLPEDHTTLTHSGTAKLRVFGSSNEALCPQSGAEHSCSYTFTETEFTFDCGVSPVTYHKTGKYF